MKRKSRGENLRNPVHRGNEEEIEPVNPKKSTSLHSTATVSHQFAKKA